jgi:D-tyrosyl-tRNA(Tyr) deacylase
MKAVIQRVLNAQVSVDRRISGKIDSGLLVYLGVTRDDTEEDARKLAEKIAFLRIFDDPEGKMNFSVLDTMGSVLAVSQFTLLADARKGRRPGYSRAAAPEQAKKLYAFFIGRVKALGLRCEAGVFQAHMLVTCTNDGPVTIILDSRELS